MPLQLLFDECLRNRRLWGAVRNHNDAGEYPLDVVRVGDPGGPGFETQDPELLAWAAEHNRVIVSQDCNTLPSHLEQYLAEGEHSPGVILVQRLRASADIVEALSVVCYCCEPHEVADRCIWLPR